MPFGRPTVNLPVSVTYPRLVVPLTFGTVCTLFLLWKMSQYRMFRGVWRFPFCGWFRRTRKDNTLFDSIEEDGNAVPIARLKEEIGAKEDALKRVDDLEIENSAQHDTILQLDKELQKQIAASDRLQQMLLEQQDGYQSAVERLKEEEAAKQEALTRLSEHISLKLADNNPNIADLSDVNRPTNLAEKFSLLYDDEWTEAFDALLEIPEYQDEEKAIKQLLEMLMVCFTTCRYQSARQMTSIFSINDTSIPEEQIPTEMKKLIKEKRKKFAGIYLPYLYDAIVGSLRKQCIEALDNNAITAYIKRCTELSWLMVVQDPPMAILTDVSEDCKYEKAKFREFTKTGPLIDFIVWPAVLIQEGGDMMAKGVAQCRDRVVEAHDEFQSDKVVIVEEKYIEDEKLACNINTQENDFQSRSVDLSDMEPKPEPTESKEVDIQKIQEENGLSILQVDNENDETKSENHSSEHTTMFEQEGADSYGNSFIDSPIQLGEKPSEKLLSADKSNYEFPETRASKSTHDTIETAEPEDYNATKNGNSFAEKKSDNIDQVCKINETIEIENRMSNTITESNVEQTSAEICVDLNHNKSEHQLNLANVDKTDLVEHDRTTADEYDDKLSSGTGGSAIPSSRDSDMEATNEVLSSFNDPNKSDKVPDTVSATEATRFQEEPNVNRVDPESFPTAKVSEHNVPPKETKESEKSPSIKEECSYIASEVIVNNQTGRIATNMNPKVDEVKEPVAESFVDGKAAFNEANNNNTPTASNIATKYVSSSCSAEANLISTKVDTTKYSKDTETSSSDVGNLYTKEENTTSEFIGGDVDETKMEVRVSNKSDNSTIPTANDTATKEVISSCSGEANITSKKIDTTKDSKDSGTESGDIANLYLREENTRNECMEDAANIYPDTPISIKQEEKDDVKQPKTEKEHE